jgi:serine/threonine-protein kinase
MFRLLTGKPVRQQRGAAEMLLSAMSEQAPSVLSAGAVPPDVAAIVDKALAFDKKDRWPDARSMQDAIREVAGRLGAPNAKLLVSTLGPSREREATGARPAPAKKSRALVILATVTLVLAVVAVAMKPLEAALRPSPEPAADPAPQSAAVAVPPEVSPSSLPTEDIELDPIETAAQRRGLPFHRRHGRPSPGTVPVRPAESSAPTPAPPPSPSSILDRRH